MPFCPQCRFEYRNDITLCSDCNQQLVDRLPVEKAAVAPDDSWLVVGQVRSEMKSEMAQGALDSNDIPTVIVTGSAAKINSASSSSGIGQVTGDGSGSYTILVHREQFDKAQVVLEAILGEDFLKESV